MIIHTENRFTGEKQSWTIHSNTDFHPMMFEYPQLRGVVFDKPLEHAIKDAADYLASLNLNVNIEGENVFEESRVISKAIFTLGLVTTIGLMPLDFDKLRKSDSVDNFPKYRSFGHKPEDKFLMAIMQLESSGGTNTNHKDPDTLGRWGLRVPTIKDTVRAYDQHNPDFQGLDRLDQKQIKELIKKRPELELHVARLLARHCLSRQHDALKAAYSWKNGHNLYPNAISLEKLEAEPYVKKFQGLITHDSIKKSETQLEKIQHWFKKRKHKQDTDDLFSPSQPDQGPDLKVEETKFKSDTMPELAAIINQSRGTV